MNDRQLDKLSGKSGGKVTNPRENMEKYSGGVGRESENMLTPAQREDRNSL